MTSQTKLNDIAGLLLAEINKLFEDSTRALIVVEIVDRLDNGSETGIIAQKITDMLFSNDEDIHVTVGYDSRTLTVQAIVTLSKKT